MIIKVNHITKEQWRWLSKDAHHVTFGQEHLPTDDRVDFVLLGVNGLDKPVGFITVRENNSKDIYWQHGGVFPGTKDTVHTYKSYESAKDWCARRYETVSTRIENENIVMLKMAMKIGFRITGTNHIFNKTYVDLTLDLKKEN